ncbi:hypothetical protein [Sanguibacter massiliensis]|uniref:hypothetical protein n=1 Tax=Sanguibacter massiliensis TaxID=1973217 RepID=UPI000C842B41|nr:hypothetical protein [Sanguibacter massiliensis]
MGGLYDVIPLLVLGLVVTAVYHSGTIDELGPITFEPKIPVMVLVPVIFAVACGASHGTATSPVIVRCARVHVARAMSFLCVVVIALGALWLGDYLSATSVFVPSVRNFMLFGGVALAAAALAGVAYGWIPVVVLLGGAVLSPIDDSPFSFYGLVFGNATTFQLCVVGLVATVGLTVAIWDPRSPGYLRRSTILTA